MSAPPNQAAALIAHADSLRDLGNFSLAAEHYLMALQHVPGRADLWVQAGNMLKDTGKYAAAEDAYQKAIALRPGNADAFLQLGRAQRLDHRYEQAALSFGRSLELQPSSRDALSEIIAIGKSWDVERQSAPGLSLALSVLETLEALKESVRRIERELPYLKALCVIPADAYDSYKRVYGVALPRAMHNSIRAGVIVCGTGKLDATLECIASIKAQSHKNFTAVMPALALPGMTPARALTGDTPRISWTEAETQFGHTALSAALASVPGSDWLFILERPAKLHPDTLAHLIDEAHRHSAAAAYCDEDVIERTGAGPDRFTHPQLRGDHDPELVDQGIGLGTLIAVKPDVLSHGLKETEGVSDPVQFRRTLLRAISASGPVVHVPHILVSTFEFPAPSTPIPAAPAVVSGLSSETVDIIVPTKNGGATLARCIDSIDATGYARALNKIHIVDNGSDDPETRQWLEAGSNAGRFSVIRDPGAFNWSRLNNRAAAATSSTMLLFLNDDIEFMSSSWDLTLRNLLSRREVGVAGGRLCYPDRTLQHAGIVLGFNGATEHEGRGEPLDAQGPLGRWQLRRNVSAVTGALLACRRADFNVCGGFDEDAFPIWFNDVDFCLKIARQGLSVLYEPSITAIHYESKSLSSAYEAPARNEAYEHAARSMRLKWAEMFERDRWYSPHYVPFGRPFFGYFPKREC